jgi:hypothetical protein
MDAKEKKTLIVSAIIGLVILGGIIYVLPKVREKQIAKKLASGGTIKWKSDKMGASFEMKEGSKGGLMLYENGKYLGSVFLKGGKLYWNTSRGEREIQMLWDKEFTTEDYNALRKIFINKAKY